MTIVKEAAAPIVKRLLNYLVDGAACTALTIIIAQLGYWLNDAYGIKALYVGPPVWNNITYSFFQICIALGYYGLFESLMYRTPGKFVTGTKVVYQDGANPGSSTVLVRTLCRMIPLEPLSFLISARGWHDSLSKTYVIDIAHFEYLQRKQLEEQKKKESPEQDKTDNL